MTTSSRTSVYELDDSLSPTDQELFSLFLQYPEIDFDSPQTTSSYDNQDLVRSNEYIHPIATIAERDPSVSTLIETSGSYSISTTPVRHPNHQHDHANDTVTGTWDNFVHLMQQSNLPKECVQYYTLMGRAIVNIGSELFANARPKRPSSVISVGGRLLKNVTYSMGQAAAQVNKLAYLKTLIAFNVTPAGPCVWTTYMERAKLITANVALPSKHELDLVQSLLLIYDSYVYGGFIHTLGLNLVDEQTSAVLNSIYHNLMTWLHNYKRWCKGMAELRYRYMRPLVDELPKLPEAQGEFNDLWGRIMKAKNALVTPAEPTVDLSDLVVQTLNLSARRKEGTTSLKRGRTRYKREHTL